MGNGEAVQKIERKIRLQENIKKDISQKFNKGDKLFSSLYPPTMLALGKATGKVLFIAWSVFLIACHLTLGTIQGIGTGFSKGLDEAARSYRRW